MLIINACIAAAIVYTGLKTFTRQRAWQKSAGLITRNGRINRIPSSEAEEDGQREIDVQLSRACTVSSISMGVSIIGAFGFPWFGLLSAPLTVYGALPALEQAFASVFAENRRYLSLVWAAVIMGLLASQRFISASSLTWLHDITTLVSHRLRFVNNLLVNELEHGYQLLTQLYGAKPSSVWVLMDGIALELPFEALQVGDTIVISTREVIPVRGMIVDGTAMVVRWQPTGNGQPEKKRVGDQVLSSSLVVSGRINVQVESI
jgi:cation transport ATPase